MVSVSVVRLSGFSVLINVQVSRTSSFDIGQGYQANMSQMADVPWISTYPS